MSLGSRWLLLLALLAGLLAGAPARAQPGWVGRTFPDDGTLWRALREHPQADRRRVDLLNQLADEPKIDGTAGETVMPKFRRDSLVRAALGLARQLRYDEGELYASFIASKVVAENRHQTVRAFELQVLEPWAARSGNKAMYSRLLIHLAFAHPLDSSSLRNLQQALLLAQQLNSPRVLCHALRALGHYYNATGDYYRGLRELLRQQRTANQAGLPDEAIDATISIGEVYSERGDYKQSITQYQRGLQEAAAARVEPASYKAFLQQIALLELGLGYAQSGDTARAAGALRRLSKVSRLNSILNLEAKLNLSEMHASENRSKALTTAKQLLRMARQVGQRYIYFELLFSISQHHLFLQQADSAIAYGQQALRIKTGLEKDHDLSTIGLLAKAYALKHDYAAAYAYQKRYTGLRDSLNNEQVTRRLTALRFEQDAARQRGRIALLTKNQQLQAAAVQRQRWLLLAALAVVGLLGSLAAVFWRSNRQKQHANARLTAQKAQIEEQAQRLGALDAAKNQFFANASHELRTPLTLVLGPLESLLTDPAQALPARARAAVALAHGQARRLHQLVNRILDLTKLQAGRLALQPQPTSLARLLRRVVAQFESLAVQRGIALTGPAALPPDAQQVLLDADKVEEILTNLLINALNHTPAGGAVLVSAALPGPDGQHAVTVRDTGPGIAAEEQTRVFERFYQSPQRQAQGGTGLGLALSRELADLLGGSLTLASEPGQGAAFTLRFPAAALPDAPPADEAAEPSAPASLSPAPEPGLPAATGPRPRVLVVEDQPDLRAYLQSLLAPTYEVLTAADGQAALELLAREAPVDLITTDAMMPRLSGIELLAQLRADPALCQVPVLMLTARADEAHRLQALTVGVDDYLTKPFATAELLARVQALLARLQVRREFAARPPETESDADVAAVGTAIAGVTAAAAAAVTPLTARPAIALPTPAEQLAQWQARVAPHLADEAFGPVELANLLCLSERTLYRRLGELAGLTPAAWLRELRLDHARRLLEAGSFGSVVAVAEAVGFGTVKLFNQRYVERFGRRPADYPA